MDGLGSGILDSQTYASEPGRPLDTLIFQMDLAPGETRTYSIMDVSALAAVPQPILKTMRDSIASSRCRWHQGRREKPDIVDCCLSYLRSMRA